MDTKGHVYKTISIGKLKIAKYLKIFYSHLELHVHLNQQKNCVCVFGGREILSPSLYFCCSNDPTIFCKCAESASYDIFFVAGLNLYMIDFSTFELD